jgi:hypothetical protein
MRGATFWRQWNDLIHGNELGESREVARLYGWWMMMGFDEWEYIQLMTMERFGV